MRTSNPGTWLALLLAVAGIAACGSVTPEPVSPPPPVTSATPAPSTAPAPMASGTPAASAAPATAPATPAAAAPAALGPAFATMTNEQKVQHMKKVIQPTMAQIFSDYDGKKYGEFGCRSCHGEKMQDPHMVLPKLTLSGDGFQKLMAAKPAVVKFMGEKVTPAMAIAMRAKPFDPATHQGFGCGGCHTVN